MPIGKKIETLSNEVFRRLHNTKEEIKWEDKTRMLDTFIFKIKIESQNSNHLGTKDQ